MEMACQILTINAQTPQLTITDISRVVQAFSVDVDGFSDLSMTSTNVRCWTTIVQRHCLLEHNIEPVENTDEYRDIEFSPDGSTLQH